MEHAATTKINDALTMRQFNRFLTNAKLPPLWEGKIKSNVLVLVCFFIITKQFRVNPLSHESHILSIFFHLHSGGHIYALGYKAYEGYI